MKVLNVEYRFQRDTFGLANGFRNADVSASGRCRSAGMA
jgi:LPS-assembly protein